MGIQFCVILGDERMTNEESGTVVRLRRGHTDATGRPVLE